MILSLLDLGFLVLLGTVVTQRILSIWMRRRRNQAGSRLHVRMVSVFTLAGGRARHFGRHVCGNVLLFRRRRLVFARMCARR